MNRCFVCATHTPCYAFAGRLICGDCASDGGLLYAELRDGEFVFEFARRERIVRIVSFAAGDLPLEIIGPVVRFYKLRLDHELERITRGEARLAPPRREPASTEATLTRLPTRLLFDDNDPHLEQAA